MPLLLGIDHVAITVADLERTLDFYDRLLGIETINTHRRDGVKVIQVVLVGGHARLSIHQQGNGIDLVARVPTPGSLDICFRWAGKIAEAVSLLESKGIAIVAGPEPRITASGGPATSVYFHDPDGNLVELLAATAPRTGTLPIEAGELPLVP